MSERMQLLLFRLDGQRYALALATVERVVRAVELTRLPGAPAVVAGAVDVAGRLLPVLCLRRRFLQPHRDVLPSDQLLIARTQARAVVLLIDEALGVIDFDPAAMVDPQAIVPGLEHFQGLVQLPDGVVLIHDLERFLSADEANALDFAMDPVP
jgi:purine-binding chemotaxis protein CheW